MFSECLLIKCVFHAVHNTVRFNKSVLTLASWALRSFTSASRDRFSPKAVLREASLELSRASRSRSLARAASRSDSFLPFLHRWKEEKTWR